MDAADHLPDERYFQLSQAAQDNRTVERAIESILHEFERLGQEPVPAEELDDSKANMTGTLPLRLETNEGVASILLSMEWHGLGLDYIQRYTELINAITAEDVQRVAQTYLSTDAYTLVVAGPQK